MADTRKKDVNWRIEPDERGVVVHDQAIMAILMDIRDELKRMNELLYMKGPSDVLEFKSALKPDDVDGGRGR